MYFWVDCSSILSCVLAARRWYLECYHKAVRRCRLLVKCLDILSQWKPSWYASVTGGKIFFLASCSFGFLSWNLNSMACCLNELLWKLIFYTLMFLQRKDFYIPPTIQWQKYLFPPNFIQSKMSFCFILSSLLSDKTWM